MIAEKEYVSTTEAMRLSGLSLAGVYYNLRNGSIEGARMVGGEWEIPVSWCRNKAAERQAKSNGDGNGNGGK